MSAIEQRQETVSSGDFGRWERIYEGVRRHPVIACLAAALLFVGIYTLARGGKSQDDGLAMATALRRDLEVVVLEGGNVQALESLELKSEVEARDGTKILSIVDEGYEVRPEDVDAKKVLIKLDPTEIKSSIEEHDIEYENALSEKTETDEQRAIQTTESQKEIKEARQTARFALLDFEKYLGEEASTTVLSERGLPVDEASLITYEDKFRSRLVAGAAAKKPAAGEGEEPPASSNGESSAGDSVVDRGDSVRIDFAKYLENELLGDGEAQQELRKRQDEWLVAQSELAVETEKIKGSERLAEKKFITKSSLELERVTVKKAVIKELSAKTQLELFRRYEFPKNSEEFLTKYEDALHLLDREKKEALAKLSQAEAKFRSAEQMFKMAKKKRDELATQLERCTIVATKPGLVVYGAPERERYFGGGDEKIEEGGSVYFKQTIVTIPDMTHMAVKVSVQESQIKKVKAGQKVRIVADAESEKTLTGEVKKVAVLPDSNRWFANPNQKLYPTEVHIDGTHDWLKPGMSANVEIVVEQLENVLCVPLQSVMAEEGDTVVYINRDGKPARRSVEIGSFSDEFIEIIAGLSEGDAVYLSKPDVGDAGGRSGRSKDTAD